MSTVMNEKFALRDKYLVFRDKNIVLGIQCPVLSVPWGSRAVFKV